MVYKKTLKEMGRKTLKGLGSAIGGVYNVFEYVYACPTFTRKHLPIIKKQIPAHALDEFIGSVVVGGNALIWTGEFIFGCCFKESPYLTYAFLPFATHIAGNAASGLYEWFRYEKRKISSPTTSSPRASSSHSSPSSSNLEKKLEKNEIKIKNIPNPWDIDFPKIENIAGGEER